MTTETSVLLDNLAFPEGPRWHEGKLWFSDMHDGAVMTVDLDGRAETVVEVPNRPSGLGWTTDGRLLVVSMRDRRLLRLDPAGLTEVADLSGLASFDTNDMVVDRHGNAFIGNFGFDLDNKAPFAPAELIRVRPDGEAAVVARDMAFPNGTVITPDGGTLIVAETFGNRLTAFDLAEDGSLRNRRVWAELDGHYPDGICLDAEGAVWLACPRTAMVLRVREGGEVTHRIPVSTRAYACMLGGPDRRTLFICTAATTGPRTRELRSGRIETVTVEVPGTGLP